METDFALFDVISWSECSISLGLPTKNEPNVFSHLLCSIFVLVVVTIDSTSELMNS